MPISNNSLNNRLYDLLKVQGFDPVPKNSKGETIPVSDDADVIKFTYKQDGKEIGPAWVTVDGNQQLKVYYDNKLLNTLKEDDMNPKSFMDFLIQLKKWAQRRQLGFQTINQDRLSDDMSKREYMKQKEKISEGYYPMGKSASYNDAIPTVKIVLQHTRQIQEGEQRFRNIAKIFLENSQGERILAPTTRPGIAQVYARHLAEGGIPNDERWNHIKSLCEEYSKMAGFVRAVRGNQFNESAQKLVEAGLGHYQSLRESLSKMRGSRGYNAYFESWTPTLMETENDESNLNELFVQETLDPRIESVMPILSKLSKNLGEMKEVSELAEWADNLLEGGDGGEASEETDVYTAGDAGEGGAEDNPLDEAAGAETLAHNQATEKSRLDAFDLDEADDAEVAHKKTQMPAFMRKQSGDPDWKTTTKDLEKAKERNISGKEGLAALTKRLDQIDEQEVEESGLQAYLGNKKYGKEGMDALRQAGRDGASKEKMAKIRAKYDKLDEVSVAEGLDSEKKARLKDLIDAYSDATDPEYMGDEDSDDIIAQIRAEFGDSTADSIVNGPSMHFPRPGHSMGHDDLEFRQMRKNMSPNRITKLGKLHKQDSDAMKRDIKSKLDVEEDLDANQKRVGQLGPYEKVGPKGAMGKLVGANENFINTDAQAVVTENDPDELQELKALLKRV
jgi:hypothetical protein